VLPIARSLAKGKAVTMADGVLGLLFQIDANPEKAKEALEAFKGHVETATSGAAASFKVSRAVSNRAC